MEGREYLKKVNNIITKKQYRQIVIKVVLLLMISTIIGIGGGLLMVLGVNENLILTGVVLFLFGTFLLIFSGVYIMFRYSAKLQMYRHYKKFPEEFNLEV